MKRRARLIVLWLGWWILVVIAILSPEFLQTVGGFSLLATVIVLVLLTLRDSE